MTSDRLDRDAPPRWREIAASEVGDWNRRLLRTSASLFQYPYWNEPLRHLRFTPRYLTYGSSESPEPEAYVCVLTLGVPGLRVALVQRGPVGLGRDAHPSPAALAALVQWARHHGCIFLRFTHSSSEALDPLKPMRHAHPLDAFPFYHEPREELVVEQHGDDEAVLMTFQSVARRNIRQAMQVGYRIECTDRPEALDAVWPLFERLSERKGFQYRPRESFSTLMRLAEPYGGAKLFIAYLEDVAVQAILVVRDREMAHYIIGALDTERLGDRASPSALVHWHAMRMFARMQVSSYDLGTRSGQVYRFKQKFHPIERIHPPALTIATNQLAYAMWSTALLPAVTKVWPRIKARLARMRG